MSTLDEKLAQMAEDYKELGYCAEHDRYGVCPWCLRTEWYDDPEALELALTVSDGGEEG